MTSPDLEPLICVTGLTFSYRLTRRTRSEPVLQDLSFRIYPGEMVILKGPSGSGKSTLLRLLNRLYDPDGGEIRYRGKPLASYPVLELRRQVVLVLSRPYLLPGTVQENLLLAVSRPADPRAHSQLTQVLAQVGLDSSFLQKNAPALSDGEKQRVALGRALLVRPRVLLLDEPTSALDLKNLTLLAATLTQIQASQGMTIIVATHQAELISALKGRIISLPSDRHIPSGKPNGG